jgi:hypothetical protein
MKLLLMPDHHRFSYTLIRSGALTVLRPLLTFSLQGQNTLQVQGLLDTGADVNILPYSVGTALGLIWEDHPVVASPSGNLASYLARGVVLKAVVADLKPVRLAFAWSQADHIPLILGQLNFFQEFDICFFRSQSAFELGLRTDEAP